jgi:hypothetical protein
VLVVRLPVVASIRGIRRVHERRDPLHVPLPTALLF